MKCSDEILRKAARWSARNDPRPEVDADRADEDASGLPFLRNCMAGCDVVAKYNSADVHMVPADASGQVTMLPDCVVREVMISDENRVTGVRI